MAEKAGADRQAQKEHALAAAQGQASTLKDAITFAFLPPHDPSTEGYKLQMAMEEKVPAKKVLAYYAGDAVNKLSPSAANKDKIAVIKLLIVRDKTLTPTEGQALNAIAADMFRDPLPELPEHPAVLDGNAKRLAEILAENGIDAMIANEAGVLFDQAFASNKGNVAQAKAKALIRLPERTGKSSANVAALRAKLAEIK